MQKKLENFEKTHRVKGVVHFNIKKQCVLCNNTAPSVSGEKTGGKW